jgi:hypothetical protein
MLFPFPSSLVDVYFSPWVCSHILILLFCWRAGTRVIVCIPVACPWCPYEGLCGTVRNTGHHIKPHIQRTPNV